MSHPYTRIVFRVGDADARELEKGFSAFEARDLQNLPIGEAVCRVERSDFDFNLKVPLPEEVDHEQAAETRRRVITASREKYATPRTMIEAELFQAAEEQPSKQLPKTKSVPFESAEPKPEAVVEQSLLTDLIAGPKELQKLISPSPTQQLTTSA